MKQPSWCLIALIRGLKVYKYYASEEEKLSGFHWEVTTLTFTPSLGNVHKAGSHFLVEEIVNCSFSCH